MWLYDGIVRQIRAGRELAADEAPPVRRLRLVQSAEDWTLT